MTFDPEGTSESYTDSACVNLRSTCWRKDASDRLTAAGGASHAAWLSASGRSVIARSTRRPWSGDRIALKAKAQAVLVRPSRPNGGPEPM